MVTGFVAAMLRGLGWLRSEEEREQDQDGEGAGRGYEPDLIPGVVVLARLECVNHSSRNPRADQHADAERHERDKPLRGRAQVSRGLLIHVDLTRHEEGAVAAAVQKDTDRRAYDHGA